MSSTTTDETKEEIMEALRAVVDPEIGLNVVELGLIRNLDLDEAGNVHIIMIMTTPFCPYAPQLVEQVRVTANTVIEGESKVEIGTELWDPSLMEEGAGGDWGLF
ncbi:MAG: metal-sulfur cluster assembly factor [Candidatus Promineifilaceae bacterium]|nr:metal-sulfur cluster assembly factor [Candidatus Promineifilaceae bacterium]